MSDIKISRRECDSCNTTVDIPEVIPFPGEEIPDAGWTRVNLNTKPSEEDSGGSAYFDLCEVCTGIFTKQMNEFLEQWGK